MIWIALKGDRMTTRNSILLTGAILLGLVAAQAHADVTTSPAQTQNMTCSGGVCTPTATKAILNSVDLESLLASGNVEVTTTGSGVQARNITVGAGLTWASTNTLALDAYHSITVSRSVSVTGTGGVALTTDDGGINGTLSFGPKGRVTFQNLSSALTINGTAYTLENNIKTLASAIGGNPSGAFAFAADYDASQDGTYSNAPVQTVFSGSFEGLGHRISNLTIDDQDADSVGLFIAIEDATLRDFRLVDAKMTAEGGGNLGAVAGDACGGVLTNVESVHGVLYGGEGEAGGSIVGGLLAGLGGDGECQSGTILSSSASGSVTDAGPEGSAGGLVGEVDEGTIELSQSSASVSAPYTGSGGLVGVMYNFGGGSKIDQSFATGKISAASGGIAGGIIGDNLATVENCYSTGTVSVASDGYAGGLAGENNQGGYNDGATITDSYSTGRVKRATGVLRGGFISKDLDPGDLTDDYWDRDTSSINKKSEGAGSPKNDSGITGLTTQQLQSGLPTGFDPKIWTGSPQVNNGLPYLVNDPPSN
jgi:hypothetical protein